jgi:hypothetical protein
MYHVVGYGLFWRLYVQIIQRTYGKQVIQYLKGLLYMSIGLGVVLYILHQNQAYSSYLDLSIISVSMFLMLSVLHYLIIEINLKKAHGQLFIAYTMAGMLLKMFASIALLVVYKYHTIPPDGKFVIPFLIIYLFFTIFETWFMMHLAGRKP